MKRKQAFLFSCFLEFLIPAQDIVKITSVEEPCEGRQKQLWTAEGIKGY